jgi:DNA-binding transcriptional LysR family regulator
MLPSLDQLEVFLAIIDAGSFRQAAGRLRRTQSAISYAITRLESTLATSLFDRHGVRPCLTAEGESLAIQARVVVAEAHRLLSIAPPDLPRARTAVSVAVDTMVAHSSLVPLLAEAVRRFPDLELSIRIESKFSLLELLINGGCQLAISGSTAEHRPGISRVPLRTFSLVPVAAPGHPLLRTPIDRGALAGQLQVLVSERSDDGRRRPAEDVAAQGRYLRVSDVPLKHELLRGGVGWGYLPWEVVERDLRLGTLVQLDLPDRRSVTGTLALLTVANAGASHAGVAELTAFIRERWGPRVMPRRGKVSKSRAPRRPARL